MKFRQVPEDFVVEEISSMPISKKKDAFAAYTLEKRGMETFSLINYIARINNIPVREIGIAGLKDKHAVTRQFCTIPSRYTLRVAKEKNFALVFCGYTNNGLELGDSKGNRFGITIRDITKGELEQMKANFGTVTGSGVPNYFDSQRFGSVINGNFVAKHLLKRDYEAAVKAYLTLYSKYERKDVKDEKRFILQKWDNLEQLKAKNPKLSRVINGYKTNRNWLEAYKRIDTNIRQMMVSAYQSYLWNECIKELLLETFGKKRMFSVGYHAGRLLFYKNASVDELKKLPDEFQTISDLLEPSGFEARIIEKVLRREGVAINDFSIKKQTGNFFKTHKRKVIICPADFGVSEPEIDELNDRGKKNRFKVTLEFSLPKGSYATIATKGICHK